MDKELVEILQTEYMIVTDCGMYVAQENSAYVLSCFRQDAFIFKDINEAWVAQKLLTERSSFDIFQFKVVQIYKSILNTKGNDVENSQELIDYLFFKDDKEFIFMASIIRLILDDRGVSYVGRSSDLEEDK